MKAGATVAVERRGNRDVVVDRRSAAPFSVRQCGERVLLASSAAAPVGGDELTLTVNVGPGARATVGSVAATMVWPGPCGMSSSIVTDCTVGSDAHLDLWLEPTVSVARSRHRATTTVYLAESATCRVVEEVVLGRTDELSGHLEVSLRVERNGLPVVHHDEAFGPEVAGALSSVSTGAARFALTAVFVGIEAGPSATLLVDHASVAWLPVGHDAAVALAVGRDRSAAVGLLAELHPSFS